MNVRRIVAVIAWLAGAGTLGCKTKECSGLISCNNFEQSFCETVPGCRRGPACELVETDNKAAPCAGAATEAACTDAKCSWTGTACVDACTTLPTQPDCFALHSDRKDEYGNFVWSCFWSQCVGRPEKPYCQQFPVNMCPTALGCAVVESCPTGDC